MGYVDYEVQGQVGIVTINKPKALNALSSEVLNDLNAVVDGIDCNAVRCVIVTGAGEKAFVAGADISEMAGMTNLEAVEFGLLGNAVFRKIEMLPVPVIAAVNGFALGGGCELSMSCDIRLCSENAVFGQPEAGLGITPGFGGTQRLARHIGLGNAKKIIYSCSNIKAPEALTLGLVQGVYPQAELMENALKLANKIAKNAPIAVRACKEAINVGMQLDIDSAVKYEANIFGRCFGVDQKEAMTAFVEKRDHAPFVNK